MASSAMLRRLILQKVSARNFSAHMDPKKAAAALDFWTKATFFGIPIAVGLGLLNLYINWEEPVRPEFIKYDHLRIRTKRFPWGDGNHSLFHNPHLNALPDGYEDEH
ncbi:hypothetical protein QAD02_016055 [Eretmocerus hayati]|uniref:Uncharacterized protein n=1 Tax=Eretmocerus hayati TaxID=131215 RepID=A0ACC2PB01_9HYME|nr:hypothetical protein QAD02_016055 [Eretmocerus hayati]